MKDLYLFSIAWCRYCVKVTWLPCPEIHMTKCCSGFLHSRAEKCCCYILHLAAKSAVYLENLLICLWLVGKLTIWSPGVESGIILREWWRKLAHPHVLLWSLQEYLKCWKISGSIFLCCKKGIVTKIVRDYNYYMLPICHILCQQMLFVTMVGMTEQTKMHL